MMKSMALAALLVLLAGCIPAASGPAGAATDTPLAPAGLPTGTPASQGVVPMGITANPPHLPVNPPGGSKPGGWQTYSSPQLGVTVDYPPSWTASRQGDGAVFTSPSGATVQLQATAPGGASGGSLQCTKVINGNGLELNACVDSSTGLYTAEASVGGARKVWLSTPGKEALGVYKQMMDSLRGLQ